MRVAQPADLSTPLAYALAYAGIGWHVMPVMPRGKDPMGWLTPKGLLNATTDPDVIRQWWRKTPQANVAIALALSGLVALDIDPRNGGTETFEALEAAHGSLRSDVMAFTGGGGEHHVFLLPPGGHGLLPGKLGPGVDVKLNGYIVVEPSIHPSGKSYGWETSSNPLQGAAPTALPDWLRGFRPKQQDQRVEPIEIPVDVATARDLREALYFIEADCADEYGNWINVGMALHETGWGRAAFAIWCAWAQQSPKFDARKSRDKWATFQAGRDDALTVAWIFAEAQKSGWINPRSRVVPDADEQQDRAYRQHDDAIGALPLLFAEDVKPEDGIVAQIVEDVLTAGGMSIFYGLPNCGKSFLACDMGCCIGAGIEWLGKRTVRGSVLYVAGEGAASIKLRIVAWRRHHGVEPWLGIIPRAVNLRGGGDDLTRLLHACEAIKQHYGTAVSLIIFDTLARAFGGGNENASEDMGALIAHADAVRERTGAHVALVHHCGKDVERGGRGHSSLNGATDTEIEVTADESSSIRTAELKKQRDLGTRGMRIGAQFSVVEMCKGQWDKPVTTCIVESIEAPPRVANKDRHAQLVAALLAVLAGTPAQTMRKADLVSELKNRGFSASKAYEAINDLQEQNVLSQIVGRVHLNSSKG